MLKTIFLLILLTVTAPAVAQRQSLGIFFRWGSFQELEPKKCFAVARPVLSPRENGWRPFASVSFWPERGVQSQLHIRLSRKKREGSAVILKIDGRSFQLVGRGADAWAPNPRADAAIVAAMRTGINMSVQTRSEGGVRVRDYHQLRGAASAIDAAAVACAPGPQKRGPAGKKPQ